jgi:hypothetical protein
LCHKDRPEAFTGDITNNTCVLQNTKGAQIALRPQGITSVLACTANAAASHQEVEHSTS